MTSGRKHESEQRIRELEARVAELSSEVETLRAERRRLAQTGRRAGDPKPPEPPLRRRLWLGRILLILTALIVGAAASITVREGVSGFDPEHEVWRQLAALEIDYILLGLSCILVFAFLMYLSKRFLSLIILCITCIYTTYWLFVSGSLGELGFSGRIGFVLSIVYITLCFAVASWLAIYESLGPGRARPRAMWVAFANTVAFYVTLYLVIQRFSPESAWFLYIGMAILAGFFAVLAESVGSHRNYLFQLFTATAILLCNAALQSVLSEEQLLLALAIECLVLAAAYHASGIVVLKVLNLAALAVTVVLGLRVTKLGTPVPLAGVVLRENWLYGLCTCGLLVFAAYYYQRHIRSLDRDQRRLSGHWFLADSFWDVPSSTAGLLHSAGAALIVMVLTISDFGDRPTLPYILAAGSVVFALLGFVFRLPQLEVGAVMLVVATHVSYYFFLSIGKEEFSDQPHFLLYTLLVLGYTYFLAHRWEKYLQGLREGHPWEHYFSAAIPYLVATVMLLTVLIWELPPGYAPLAFAAAGTAFILIGALTASAPIKTSGVAAIMAGVVLYLDPYVTDIGMRRASNEAWGIPAAMLGMMVLSERAMLWGRRTERDQAVTERLTRTMLVLLFAITGFVSARALASPGDTHLLWLGLVFLCAVLGAVFRENRYRWFALLVLAGALFWAFGYERLAWSERSAKVFIAGSAGMLLLIIGSWGITWRRTTDPTNPPASPSIGVSTDG
jgi:hypothetical protein